MAFDSSELEAISGNLFASGGILKTFYLCLIFSVSGWYVVCEMFDSPRSPKVHLQVVGLPLEPRWWQR